MNRTVFAKWPDYVPTAVAAFSLLLGLLVAIGWHLESLTLVQPVPSVVPMQYNTALAFIVVGVGLFASVWGLRRVVLASGALVTGFGGLVIAQYVFGVDLRIDTLLIDPFTVHATLHPGRASPSTALNFVLVGTSLLLMGRRGFRLRPLTLGLLGAIVIALALVGVFAYTLDLSLLYGFDNLAQMDAPTCLGFILLGFAIISRGWAEAVAEADSAPTWSSLLVAIGVITATLVLWAALVEKEYEHIDRAVEAEAESVKNEIAVRIQPRVLALVRMANEWEEFGRPSRRKWEFDSLLSYRNYGGYLSVQWIDPRFQLRWIVPAAEHEAAPGFDAAFDERRRRALEEARDKKTVTVTRAIDLVSGGKGMVVQVPIFEREGFAGFIAGVFRLEELLGGILGTHVAAGYGITVLDGNERIFERYGERPATDDADYIAGLAEPRWTRDVALNLYGTPWRVRVWPQEAVLQSMRSPFPWIVLTAGLVLAFLLSWTLYLAQHARVRERQIALANRALTAEVTERRQVEADLRLSKERYRNLFDSIREGLIVADTEGAILACNPAFSQLFGQEGSAFVGRDIRSMLADEQDFDHIKQALQERNGLALANRTIWFRKQNGEHFPGETSMFCLKDASARVIGVVALIRDVSERAWAEAERQRVASFNHLLQRVAGASNQAGRIEEAAEICVEAVCHTTGWQIGHLGLVANGALRSTGIWYLADAQKYAAFREAMHEKDCQSRTSLCARVLEHGAVQWANQWEQDMDLPAAAATGIESGFAVPIWVKSEVAGVLQFYSEQRMQPDQVLTETMAQIGTHLGRVIERVRAEAEIKKLNQELEQRVLIRTAQLAHANRELETEIAERKRAEESLAAETERLAVTLHSIADGVITTDTQGRVTLLNHVAEELTGWCADEAMGRPLSEVFHILQEDTREAVEDPVAQVIRTSATVEAAARAVLIARDGTERKIADSGSPIWDKGGRILGVVLVFRDITEKQRMEEDLIKAQKLESIGVLAGGIAHDFNNILTAILGNVALAKMHSQPGDAVNEALSEAEKAFWRARDLTQQLLTFAKGGAPIRKSASIKELLIDTAKFASRGSKVRCRFSVASDLWPTRFDAGQMSQVINNLVLNAIEAMPEGGSLRVSAKNITLAAHQLPALDEGRYVRLTIADEGIGIPEHNLRKIFDPYFTTKQKGTGLGLATVYSIVKRHDGHIEAESKQDAGASFHVYLPAAEEEGVRPAAMREPPLEKGVGRILVMDDEESVRKVAVKLLEGLGYRATAARNGEEAIRLYVKAREGHDPFAAVVLDLTVPGSLGGKECVQQLRALDPEVKAVVSSGYSNDPVMAEFARYGFQGVVAKPYQLKELGDVLAKVLKHELNLRTDSVSN